MSVRLQRQEPLCADRMECWTAGNDWSRVPLLPLVHGAEEKPRRVLFLLTALGL